MSRSHNNEMVALSIRQPYAEMILRGLKKSEYRSNATRKRRRVYIYASKKSADRPELWRKLKSNPGDLSVGVLVGTVEIVGCSHNGDEYEWKLARPKRLRKPLRPTRRAQPVFFRPF